MVEDDIRRAHEAVQAGQELGRIGRMEKKMETTIAC